MATHSISNHFAPVVSRQETFHKNERVAEDGATLTGVANGMPVTPGEVLSIGATGAAAGAKVTLTISNLVNNTVVTTTELPYSYTMPEYDAYVSVAAVQDDPGVTPESFSDPQGTPIEDPAVIDWLRDNGFTQADIDALGNNYAALDKFYKAYIANYDFRVQGADTSIKFTNITTVGDDVSVTVQLVRKAPLGALHGKLYIYGANDLTDSFSRLVDTSVSFGGTDETFDTQATQGTVTQTPTATLSWISYKFFRAQIHAEIPDNGEW